MNRPTLRAAPALACAALCAALLAACGDAGGSGDAPDGAAAKTLQKTATATSKLRSARLTIAFQLAPEGLLALGGPITLHVSGPFATGEAGKLPRLHLALAGTIAQHDLDASAISTGDALFLRIDGRDYTVDDRFVAAMLGDHGKNAARKPGTSLQSFGIDPSAWVKDPRAKGSGSIGGVDTTHIAGALDVRQLLADLARLLGGGGTKGAGGLLAPKLRDQIASAVKTSKIDVWSGAKDRILRQADVVVGFAFDKGEQPPIAGLDGGTITMRVRLDDVNATTADPAAPKDPQPLAKLTGAGGLGAFLDGLGAGILGGDGGQAFLRCLSAAARGTAGAVRCVSKLAPSP